MRPLRVCFWSTAFQADTQALAYHLAEQPGFEVLVAMDEPDTYQREAVCSLMAFRGQLTDRGLRGRRVMRDFQADLMIIDNHLPRYRVAPRMFVLWHGFGWRVDDVRQMRKEIRRHVGPVEEPNERFRWQAFGEQDREYRIRHSKLAPENVALLGSAYSDLLRPDSELSRRFDRASVAKHYRIDVTKKTIMFGLTWHHGGALSHWGEEEDLLARIAQHLASRDVNLLLRMHNRGWYEKSYIKLLERVAGRHSNIELKFKSDHPDSLVDVLISDAMVSNYSSFLNPYYHTQKPSIHINPIDLSGQPTYYRKLWLGRLKKVKVRDPLQNWRLAPDQVGGLRVSSLDELIAAMDRVLAEPTCCGALARDFVSRYIASADGETRSRIERFLGEWCSAIQ